MLLKKGVHILTKKMDVCTINREEDCREVHGQIPTWCKSTLLCCVQQQTVWTANTRIGAFLAVKVQSVQCIEPRDAQQPQCEGPLGTELSRLYLSRLHQTDPYQLQRVCIFFYVDTHIWAFQFQCHNLQAEFCCCH